MEQTSLSIYSPEEFSSMVDASLRKSIEDSSIRLYVVGVVTRYAHLTGEQEGGVTDDPRKDSEKARVGSGFLKLKMLNAKKGPHAFRALKTFGDRLLLRTGLFADQYAYQEAYSSHLFKRDFYIEQGSEAYSCVQNIIDRSGGDIGLLVSSISAERQVSDDEIQLMTDGQIFSYLSAHFPELSSALFATREDVFRCIGEAIYRDSEIAERLKEQGLVRCEEEEGLPWEGTTKKYVPVRPHLPSRGSDSEEGPIFELNGIKYRLNQLPDIGGKPKLDKN
jgi:hypothetical protein